MKKLFLILVIVSNMAQADTWTMKNNGGGQIVLTDRKCAGQKYLNQAYTYTTEAYLDGCWGLIDGKVHIVWGKNQGRRVYEINDFVPDQVTPKKQGTAL